MNLQNNTGNKMKTDIICILIPCPERTTRFWQWQETAIGDSCAAERLEKEGGKNISYRSRSVYKKQLEQFGMIRGRLVMVLRLENLYTVLAAAVPGYIMGQIVSFAVIRALTFRQDELPCVETVVPSGNPACSSNVRACHGIPEPPDGYWYLSYIFDIRLKLPYIKDVCLISLNFFIFILKYILLI